MKLIWIIIAGVVIVRGGVIKDEQCDGVTIDGIYHEKEVLKTDVDRPYLLSVDYATNMLYFSYSTSEENNEFLSAQLNINTKEFKNIAGVLNGFAQTVDRKSHDVYIGGSDGIYKFDHNTNKVELIGEKDTDIWNIHFNEVLYYSVYPSQFLYTLVDGVSLRYKDLEDTKVDNFIISNDSIYYTNATGLYVQEKGTKSAVLLQELNDGIRGMTTDINGNVFACMQDGIYAVKNDTDPFVKVADVFDTFGVAFDNDNNIIYGDSTSLVRLKPNSEKSC